MDRSELIEKARRLDEADALSSFRSRFFTREGEVYLDGNSLGLMSRESEAAVLAALGDWKRYGVSGWGDGESPWFHLCETLAGQLAPIVGARPQEVIVTASTTINLHQLLATFYKPQPGRSAILIDPLNFPSDRYAVFSAVRTLGLDPESTIRDVPSRDGRTLSEDDIIAAFTDDVAVAILPAVLYRSGQLLNLETVTAAAHERGIVIGWDLCHSAGVIPHRLHESGADFAFFCTYKYLNGGPGSVGALFVHERHFGLTPAFQGWFGSDKTRQFDMLPEIVPAAGAGGYQVGTPHVLSAASLKGSLAVIAEAGIERIRSKSVQQTAFLIEAADALLAPYGFIVGTPRNAAQCGGHVALEHEQATRIVKALKAARVIPDFRPPTIVRLGPNPLYTSFGEILEAVLRLERIMRDGSWQQFELGRDEIA